MKSTTKPTRAKKKTKTASARRERQSEAGYRLLDALELLSRSTGATIDEMQAELGVSRSTALRYIDALDTRGYSVCELGKRNRCNVLHVQRAQRSSEPFTLEEAFWLKVMEGYTSCFAGTGIDDAIKRVSEKIASMLKPKARARLVDLSRKIVDVPDHAHDYSDKSDVIDELLTGLLKDQSVVVKQESTQAELRKLRIDPYTILTYKRALYIAGLSHHHGVVRMFAIERIRSASRIDDASFVCPPDYDPHELYEGAFGLIRGEEIEVLIRFEASVEPWLRRRKWHATQRLEKKGEWLYLTMRPRGTKELLAWILSWGAKAVIVSPASLRDEWRRQAEKMVANARELDEASARRLPDVDDD
jgi:predicted DNA-binding transcriptional regulator YafY